MNEISFRTALRHINKLGNVRSAIDSPLGFFIGDWRDRPRGKPHAWWRQLDSGHYVRLLN